MRCFLFVLYVCCDTLGFGYSNEYVFALLCVDFSFGMGFCLCLLFWVGNCTTVGFVYLIISFVIYLWLDVWVLLCINFLIWIFVLLLVLDVVMFTLGLVLFTLLCLNFYVFDFVWIFLFFLGFNALALYYCACYCVFDFGILVFVNCNGLCCLC